MEQKQRTIDALKVQKAGFRTVTEAGRKSNVKL